MVAAMSSQSCCLTSSHHCIQQRQHRFLELAPRTSSPPPARLNRPRCPSCLGSLQRSLGDSQLCRGRASSHRGKSRARVILCQGRPVEDSQLGDGPLEPQRPGFSRQPHSPLSFIPADDPAAAPLPPKKIKISPRLARRRRNWKKATPAQAMAGAVVGGLWAALALKGTVLAYERLDSHPLAHDLPMGMTNNVNQILITAVTGFGGFAVLMFSVSSCGLALLTLKLISARKPPIE